MYECVCVCGLKYCLNTRHCPEPHRGICSPLSPSAWHSPGKRGWKVRSLTPTSRLLNLLFLTPFCVDTHKPLSPLPAFIGITQPVDHRELSVWLSAVRSPTVIPSWLRRHSLNPGQVLVCQNQHWHCFHSLLRFLGGFKITLHKEWTITRESPCITW